MSGFSESIRRGAKEALRLQKKAREDKARVRALIPATDEELHHAKPYEQVWEAFEVTTPGQDALKAMSGKTMLPIPALGARPRPKR